LDDIYVSYYLNLTVIFERIMPDDSMAKCCICSQDSSLLYECEIAGPPRTLCLYAGTGGLLSYSNDDDYNKNNNNSTNNHYS